jgi:ATP synthase F1 delta subunit
MNLLENILAKKYAVAFLNLTIDSISQDDYYNLKTAAEYCKKNYTFFFLLNTPTIPITTKKTTLVTLLQQLNIPQSLQSLVELILKHQRVFLLPAIFEQLVRVYEQRKKIVPFTFYSSHTLDKNQCEILRTFLTKKTNCHITYKQSQSKKLIAGIRMQSDFFLWEYSVAKQLRALRKTIRQ